MAGATGAVVTSQTFDYDAFGTTLINAGSAQTVWLYGDDGVYDRATGLTYNLARWRSGFEFTQTDPFAGNLSVPASLPRYPYVGADPTLFYDPSGAVTLLDTLTTGAVVADTEIANANATVDIGALEGAELDAITSEEEELELEAVDEASLDASEGLEVDTSDPAIQQAMNDEAADPYGDSENLDDEQNSSPSEPYNRDQHYPNSPTQSDRTALGAGENQVVDHDPPLVQRYYEGDPATGEQPGWQMTPEERAESAADQSRMQLQSKAESDAQGGRMSQYSQGMIEFFRL